MRKSYGCVVPAQWSLALLSEYENENFFGDSGDLIVDLRFERVCGASADLPG